MFEKPEGIEREKSCCKVKSHEQKEIVFACYECKDTFCRSCLEQHCGHTLIYFKDQHIVLNYSHVLVAAKQQEPSTQPSFDVFYCQTRFTKQRVVVKMIKDFKQKPLEFRTCVLQQIHNQIALQAVPMAKGLVHDITYSIVNNNLYVVSAMCVETLR